MERRAKEHGRAQRDLKNVEKFWKPWINARTNIQRLEAQRNWLDGAVEGDRTLRKPEKECRDTGTCPCGNLVEVWKPKHRHELFLVYCVHCCSVLQQYSLKVKLLAFQCQNLAMFVSRQREVEIVVPSSWRKRL